MADPKKVTALTLATTADAVDETLIIRGNALQRVPLQQTPVSDPVSQALAVKADNTAVAAAVANGVTLARDRSQGTGVQSPDTIVFPDGQTLTQKIALLLSSGGGGSANDPRVLTAPVVTGTVGTGNDLTAVAGPVTDGSGGTDASTALDFGAGAATNTTRRLTTSTLKTLNDTTGWVCGCVVRLATFSGGDCVFMGFGTSGAASSMQIRTFSGTDIGVQVRDASGSNIQARITLPAAGTYWVFAQYSDAEANVRLFVVPAGGAVSGQSDGTAAALATITPGSGWYIGGDGTAWNKLPLGECFVADRLLTNAEMTAMAAGAPITSILTPALYWRFRGAAATTEPNLGSLGTAGDATYVGSGYTTTTKFFTSNFHQNEFTWRLTLGGVPSVLFTETKYGAVSTFKQAGAQVGGFITCDQVPIDPVTLRRGNQLTSNTKGPVTSVLATNSGGAGLPKFTQTGSVASGTTVTLNAGSGWSNATKFIYYMFLNGGAAFYTSAKTASTSITFDLTNAQVGTVTMGVIAFNADDLPHAGTPLMAAAGLTVTGAAPGVTVQTALAFAAHLYLETPSTLTEGVYRLNGVTTTPDIVYHDFGKTSAAPGVYFRVDNTGTSFTPRAAGDGLALGDTVFIDSRVVIAGVTYGPFRSGTKSIEATPGTLQVSASQAAQAGISLTQNVAMTTTTLGTITGGSGQYTNVALTSSTTPAVPSNLVATIVPAAGGNAATVTLSGTPSATKSSDTITVTVTDSAGATAQMTFQLVVNQQSVTPLASLPYPVPMVLQPQASVTYNDGATIILPAGSGRIRIQKLADPGGGSMQVYLRRIYKDEHPSGNVRNEKRWADLGQQYYLTPGNEYWQAFALRPKLDEWPLSNGGLTDNIMLVYQLHSESTADSQPDQALVPDIGNNRMFWQRAWNATPDTDDDPATNTSKDWIGSYPSQATWYKFITRIVPGYQAGQGPITQVWMQVGASTTWTLIVDKRGATDWNTHAIQGFEQGTWASLGFYKWSSTGWPSPDTIAAYFTTLYQETGTGKFANAAAALVALTD